MVAIMNSSSDQKHNALLTIVIGIIVAIGRIRLIERNQNDITTIMSVVNVVAFGFVFIILCNDIYNKVNHRIINSGIDTSRKKEMKIIVEVLFLLFFGSFSIIAIEYVIKFKTATYNDAISIIALALSIANDGFVDCIESPTYKIVSLINKSVRSLQKLFKHFITNFLPEYRKKRRRKTGGE